MNRVKKLAILDWATMSARPDELMPKQFAAVAESMDVYPLTAPEETVRHIGSADAVLCNKVLITRDVLAACPNIRYIGVLATGFNNIDLEAASARGIPVCNAGSYSTDAVAQLVFSYILDYCERTSLYAMDTRLGRWETSPTFSYFPYPTTELRGKTLGILGYGNIGRRVAEIGNVFGMRILISTRTQPQSCPYETVSVGELFRRSDFLTVHCPLNEGTKEIVSRENLSLMKSSAVLINTSRGGTVDEHALAYALLRGKIAAAYLDVLCTEPMAEDCLLKEARNCCITPHIGWTPRETRQRLLDITEDNLRGWLCGNPQHVVNHVSASQTD